MDNNKIMIVGIGNVGASIAFALLHQRTAINEIILTDILAKDAEGEVMDLSDALAVAPSYLKIRSGTYKDAKNCDVVIITAGITQKPQDTRLSLIKKNANILKGMVTQIMDSGFQGIFLVITNPVDIMAYLTWKFSGLPSEQVIGTGTILDSARLKQRLANYLDLHPKSINAYQIGEHGDSEVTPWSLIDIAGQPISELLDETVLEDITNFVKNEAYTIIDKKGATYYGVATCATQILNCIFNDERRILPVSSYDDFTDTYYGFPAVVGREGIIRRLDLKLSELEGIALQKSINILKSAQKSLKLDKIP